MNIEKIILTGDILRPDPKDQTQSESVRRIRWLEDLLSPVLSQVTTLPVRRLACNGNSLDFETLYLDCGCTPSFAAWANIFAGELPTPLKERLIDIFQGALVVGIEMSPSLVSVLSDAGIPVIDCAVDPLRFLYDIPLAWRSSVPGIRLALENFRLSPLEVGRRVAQIRAKSRWLADPKIPEGATLVLEQVQNDSALIDVRQGKMVELVEYIDRLTELKNRGPVIWRGHPSNTNHEQIAEILGECNKTHANFYHLLAHDDLAGVAAISSGGIVEARAFGKEGIHFLDRFDGIDIPNWSNRIPVMGDWLSPHFWSAVLAPVMDTRKDAPVFVVEKDAFRRTTNFDWQFGWIDQISAAKPPNEEEIVRAREQDLVRRIEYHDARNASVTAQLGQLVPHALSALYPRLRKLLQTCESNHEKVAVWGTGGLARLLVERGVLVPANISLWIDIEPTRWGQDFMGTIISDPVSLMLNECDVVIICTLLPPDEILVRIKEMDILTRPVWIGDQFDTVL